MSSGLDLESLRTTSVDERDEIELIESSFHNLAQHFYLTKKIGEGTFSCVYRAVDLMGIEDSEEMQEETPRQGNYPVVAVKRVHVTSSASRIANELEILGALSSSPYVCHLVTAMRDEDQVLVVMEYKEHTDFRTFYKDCPKDVIRTYMRQLLLGLEFVHKNGVLHRDIKPTNFLFDLNTRTGALADFGLAEFITPPRDNSCVCVSGGLVDKYKKLEKQGGIRINDTRPSKRANRAGTRGFRAPEVLFKCNRQTPKIDIWAAGVILLMFLSRRFPYFNSMDDSEALSEITVLLGTESMSRCALLHGVAIEVNIPGVTEGKLDESKILDKHYMTDEMSDVRSLLSHLMDPDYRSRFSAESALRHRFFDQE